jgi:hypothetical protein
MSSTSDTTPQIEPTVTVAPATAANSTPPMSPDPVLTRPPK